MYSSSSSSRSGRGGDISVSSLSGDITFAYSDLDYSPVALTSFSFTTGGNADKGGDITLLAPQGSIRGRGISRIQLNSFSTGAGGNNESGSGGSVRIVAGQEFSGFEILTLSSSEQSGDVDIRGTGDLIVENTKLSTSAQVSIENPFDSSRPPIILDTEEFGPSGNTFIRSNGDLVLSNVEVFGNSNGSNAPAGQVKIEATSVTLNQTEISVSSISDREGGDIIFNVDDTLLLRNGSLINAEATDEGDGGNIDIDAGFVVGLPNENSDIIANAFGGTGGNIDITATQIFGFIQRSGLSTQELRSNTTSDISASSQLGLQGVIDITTLEEDPSRSLTELPVQPQTPDPLQTCQTPNGEPVGSFVSTGRSGLPLDPTDPLNNSDIWEDVHPPSQQPAPPPEPPDVSSTPDSPQSEEVEAAGGWVVNDRGNVELVATMPRNASTRRCPIFQSTGNR